jgi:hypothetical protein
MKKRRRFRFPLALAWIGLVVCGGVFLNLYLALRPAAIEARFRAELGRFLRTPFQFSSLRLSWNGGAEIRDLRLFLEPSSGDSRTPEETAPGAPAGLPEGALELLSARSVRLLPDFPKLLSGSFEIKQVILDSPFLRVSRARDGSWNWSRLLRSEGPPLAASRLPSVLVEGGRLAFGDERTFREPFGETVEDMYARLAMEPNGTISFRAQVRSALARKLDVSGSASGLEGKPVVRFRVEAKKLDLSRIPPQLLSAELAEEARRLKLEGFLDLQGDFKYDSNEGLSLLGVVGNIVRCEFLPPFSPFPVKGLKGTFLLKERTLEIREVEGGVGGGKLAGLARVEFDGPWLFSPNPSTAAWWTVKCEVSSFLVDRRIRDALPPSARKVFDEFQPHGKVGLELKVLESRQFPPRADEVSATLRLDGLDCRYYEFPYLVQDLQGELLIEKGRVKFKQPIEARNGPISVKISGGGVELSRRGDVDVTIKVDSVPLDERFRSALPEEAHEIWDAFQLLGSGDGIITIFREGLKEEPEATLGAHIERPRVVVTAYPRGVRMSYRQFPYEVSGISGNVHFDTRARRLTFEKLEGRHGEQVITGNGVFEIGPPSRFNITLHTDSLPVDEDLISGFSLSGQRLLRDFDFRGRVKADVKIESTGSGSSQVKSEVSILEGSVRHQDFPYPLDLAQGNLIVMGDQTIEFKGISTPEGSVPHVLCDGILTTKDRERMLTFNLDVKDLRFDAKLAKALPPELASFVKGMKLGGVYDGQLDGTYSFDEATPDLYSIRYRGVDVIAREAAVDFGLKIHDMSGTGTFIGDKVSDQPHRLRGSIYVDSAWFNRVHLTKGNVIFSLGEEHPAIQAARAGKKIEGHEYSIPQEMVSRLSGEKVKDTFQMLVNSPDVYGGKVDGFLFVDTGDLNDLSGDFSGRGLQVSKAAEDIFGAKATGSGGEARGKISFHGRNGDYRSITGKGEGFIENARLVELPLFLSLLSVLFGGNSTRHYFNEVILKYGVADGQFKADKSDGIEIRSAGLKLVGGGTLDFDGKLDLTFEPRVLDFKIPVVDTILTVVKKGLAQIWVTGDLAKPQVQFVTVGGILRIGIESGDGEKKPPLPTDLRKTTDPKEPPPQPVK